MSTVKRPDKAGTIPIRPPKEPFIEKQFKVEAESPIDPQTLSALLGKKGPEKISAYFTGAPVWSESAQKKLEDFVIYALKKNALFRDKPHATEAAAKKIRDAIMMSPNLTAQFLPFISDKQ